MFEWANLLERGSCWTLTWFICFFVFCSVFFKKRVQIYFWLLCIFLAMLGSPCQRGL